MKSSDDLRQQVDAAEQRGLAFFNKLTQRTPQDEDEESLRMDVEQPQTPITPSLPKGSTRFGARQMLQRRFNSPPATTGISSPSPGVHGARLSSSRPESYPSPVLKAQRTTSDVTVTFSFVIPGSKLQALPMTLNSGLSITQVKTMVYKKINSPKVQTPSDLVFNLNGIVPREAITLSEIPVFNGANIKVKVRNDVDDGDDSLLKNQSTTFFQTPKGKDKYYDTSGILPTPSSAPPSSIKQSPFSIMSSSPHHPNEITGLSPFHSAVKSHRLTSTQKTFTGGSVMSEEAAFYEILEDVFKSEGNRKSPAALSSVEDQCHLAETYAREVADRYEATASQLSLHTSPRTHQQLLRDLEDLRAERDLWSLTSQLLMQGLLKDIQDVPNENALRSYLDDVAPSVSLKEVINSSIEKDERIKKGRVLKDWVESCCRDLIHEPPEPLPDDDSFPWTETLHRLKNDRKNPKKTSSSPTGVTCVHPDAQVNSKGVLIPLDGDDHTDQETLLKVIWQHIRGGQLVEAQSLAHKHKVHWLTAALMGVAEEFYLYDTTAEDENDSVKRRGNKNRPIWVQICWNYASKLDTNAVNKTSAPVGTSKGRAAGPVAALEAGIYAALSSNYVILKDSLLLQTYSDHLWAKIRCAHERQLTAVSNTFRKKRREVSSLFPGTSDKVLAAESKYLADTIHLQASFSYNGAELVRDMMSLKKKHHSSVSGIILQLQCAMIQGKSAISVFIQNDIRAYAARSKASCMKLPSKPTDETAVQTRVLRVFVHFLIWLRFSCGQHIDLQDLVPSEILYLVLEAYIACLAQRQQYSLVALYCSYLSRPKRLGTYIAMLHVISPTSVRSEEGHIVPASTLHAGGTATMAGSLAFTSGGQNFPLGNASMTCMSLSGRNTGMRGVDDDATAQEVLTLAKKFFAEEDIVDITNAVVDQARKVEGLEKSAITKLGVTGIDFSNTFHMKNAATSLSADQKIGAESMALASQTSTTTAVPGFYDEGIIPADDAQRMETLRWLCYYEDQAADAAKEANAFLRSFMVESSGSKTLQVRVLMTNIIPNNFITTGSESLQLKLAREENETVRRNLEDIWDAEVGQLILWKYIDWSIFCYENFQKEVQNFFIKQSEFIGDAQMIASSLYSLKHQILRSADTCLKSIRKALGCGGGEIDTHGCMYFDEGGCDFDKRGGFLAIWCTSIDTTVGDLVQVLVSHNAATGLKKSNTEDVVHDNTVAQEALKDCYSLLEKLEVSASLPDLDEGSVASSLFSPPAGLELVRSNLKVIEEAGKNCSVSFQSYCILEKARDLLSSILDNRRAMYLTANILVKHFVEVCTNTALVLETLRTPPAEVLQWHQEAADVAVILADEAENMQLYKALEVEDLKLILSSVAVANVHILRIQKSFDIFAE